MAIALSRILDMPPGRPRQAHLRRLAGIGRRMAAVANGGRQTLARPKIDDVALNEIELTGHHSRVIQFLPAALRKNTSRSSK